MTTLGFYFSLDKPDANALRRRLNDIAAGMGYIATAGPTAGAGNVAALLEAIDAGEVALVLLPNEQRYLAITALHALAAANPGDEWPRVIADALVAATDRQDDDYPDPDPDDAELYELYISPHAEPAHIAALPIAHIVRKIESDRQVYDNDLDLTDLDIAKAIQRYARSQILKDE